MKETSLNGKTPDIAEENIKKLRQIFPDVFTEDKVDFEKLQQVLGDYVEDSNERYNFTWNGKGQALRLSQTPSLGTLRPCKDESKDWDTTQNLYIEGDNLEVLKLLQKSYHGKIKMIYIDPPYNTGKDFVYPDNFHDSLENYKQITGQMDSEGNRISTNTEASGRYHTDWLNMMYPRLRLARNLLSDDGVIFISISDAEVENLKKVCNEIFGEDNFVAQLTWENKEGGGSSDSKFFRIKHEYILCYSKDNNLASIKGLPVEDEDRYRLEDKYVKTRGKYQLIKLDSASLGYIKSLDYPIIGPGGIEIYPNKGEEKISRWRWSKNKLKWGQENDFVVIQKDRHGEWAVYTKQYLNCDNEGNIIERTIKPIGVIDRYSTTQSNRMMKKLMDGAIFQYSKPYELMKFLIEISIDEEQIVLDFFSGSATTAHATMQLNAEDGGNHKFIMVQLPEPTDEKSEAYKAGYKNICEIGKERIRRAGEKIKEENKDKENIENLDIGFKVLKLDTSNIRKWQPDSDNLEQSLLDYVDNYVEGRTELDVVYEIMLKYGLDLTYPVDEFVVAGKKVYSIGFGMLMICLDNEITTDVAKGILERVKELEPESSRVVFKDNGFKTDSNKTNIKEILKIGGIEEFITL